MRIAIYGAGSLGTVLGAYMAKNVSLFKKELEIELYNRNKAHVESLNAHGAVIDGEVSFTQPVKAILPEQMEGEFDYIFLMTKVLNNNETVNFLKDHLKKDGAM